MTRVHSLLRKKVVYGVHAAHKMLGAGVCVKVQLEYGVEWLRLKEASRGKWKGLAKGGGNRENGQPREDPGPSRV